MNDQFIATNLAQVNPLVEKQLNAKAHASYGTTLLTSASAYDGMNTGQSPTGRYTGFLVGDAGVTVSEATYWNNNTNTFATGESLASFSFTAGQYYPFPEGKTITISAGNIMLIKGEPTQA